MLGYPLLLYSLIGLYGTPMSYLRWKNTSPLI